MHVVYVRLSVVQASRPTVEGGDRDDGEHLQLPLLLPHDQRQPCTLSQGRGPTADEPHAQVPCTSLPCVLYLDYYVCFI